jgi:predicted enzyme related to lactoylglutathione lyase
MASHFVWYELMTDDVAGAKAFYDNVVGWTIAAEPVAPGMDYRMIGRSDGGHAGGVLGLTDAMVSGGARPGWLGYLHAPDIDSTVAAIEADGGAVQMPATDMPGVGRIAMVADPQGAQFYLMRPTPPPGAEDAQSDVFSVVRPQHVRWNELTAIDDAAALAFYSKHFGWTQSGSMPMGPAGNYTFLAADGVGIGAAMASASATAASWRYYIGVADIDAAVAAVKAGGGEVLDGPHQIPGGEFSVHGRDPQGASFGLVGPRKE